ncbi:MAG: hypothetical protein ABIJ97_08670 [Bacteroidota bacterium]
MIKIKPNEMTIKPIVYKAALCVIVSGFFFLTNCGKFEEGPKFSFKSKTSRIAGEWAVEIVTKDGITQPDSLYSGFSVKFDKNGDFQSTKAVGGNVFTDLGSWEFYEDIKLITSIEKIGATLVDTIEILKLKSKELWVTDILQPGDIVVETHYIPK